MSLLFADSFDHYASADILKKWNIRGATLSDILPTSGRRGGGCITAASAYEQVKFFAGSNTLIFGGAINPQNHVFSNSGLFSFVDAGGNRLILISPSSNGQINVYRGNKAAALGATSPNLVPGNTYTYLEVKATIHSTTGSVVVRVNNVVVLSLSNVNTGTDGALISGIAIGGGSNNPHFWDDVYVCNNSGATNNDFLGDVRIDALRPNGPGFHQDFAPSTGVDHAATVDETVLSTTDYVSAGTPGAKETFTLTDSAVVGAVKAVQIVNAVGKADAGPCLVKNLLRVGGANYQGVEVSPSISSSFLMSPFDLNPSGSVAWTTAAVNALEAGLEITTA